MNEKDPTFLGQLITWAGAGISALFAWLWTHTMGRLSSVEKEKLNRKEFEEAMQRAETSRQEVRGSVITLFGEVKDLRDHVDTKFDRLADLIREHRR